MNEKKKQLLKEVLSKKETRVKYLEQDFMTFCLYYFPSSFHYPKIAPFHKKWCSLTQEWYNIYIEWHRESAKTMLIWLLYDLWCICYRKKRFICVFSYEQKSSSFHLFQIAIQLQTNKRLINDFWQLFFSDNVEKKSQKKSVNEFITENDIKLKAFSMWTSMRWQVFMSKDGMVRPDSLLLDDIDNINSVKNKAIIDQNMRFLEDEVFWGLANYCQIRILGNVIMEDWLNPSLKQKYKNNASWSIQSQKVVDENGEPVWDRYTKTNKEAEEYNKDIQDPKKHKISLEKKLNDLWEISFNQNYLLKPFSNKDRLIKSEYIRMFDENIEFDYIEAGIDPAFSEKTKSDSFSITVTGFKKVENVLYRYVLEEISLKWEEKNNQNICRTVLNMYLNYKPRNIKVEKNNGWEIYAKLFKDPANMWGYNLPITTINATKDKWTRLKEFEGCFQRWEIFFKVWKTDNLIEQLLYFTGESGNKDDAVDSMVHSFGLSWVWFYFDTI